MIVTEAEMTQARQYWGAGLVAISEAFASDSIDGARVEAARIVDSAYGYDLGPVLFKPTMASGQQTFRPTRDGALSYFVGHDPEFPNDAGFGINGWRVVESLTSACLIEKNIALWMGSVILTDGDGKETKVDKSWGYKRCPEGRLKIVLHHSSLPFRQS